MISRYAIMLLCCISLLESGEKNSVDCLQEPLRGSRLSSANQVPNKSRYGEPLASYEVKTIEQVFDFDLSSGDISSPEPNKYRISRALNSKLVDDIDHEGSELDSEDRRLLDKFYRESYSTQEGPVGGGRQSQEIWDESHDKELAEALMDVAREVQVERGNQQVKAPLGSDEWTIDTQLMEQSKHLLGGSKHTSPSVKGPKIASYSPTMRLLTSYNPTSKHVNANGQVWNNQGIVGTTLSDEAGARKPNISSELFAAGASKLHDELLEEPPRDGKVRVRMYFHRAIHDDVKLYGTGPWRYWGHGWGVEFGYKPREDGKAEYYEKGYTIERAFGRDFCRDKKNCRPPDPSFRIANNNKLDSAKKV